LAQKFEHSADPAAYRDNEHVKVIMSTTKQPKSQQHVQFGAYEKRMVKKLCTSNPNEATNEFDYAPSKPEKRQMNLSYAAVVTTPVSRSEYYEAETEKIDLTLKEPWILTGFTNVSKLLQLENSIKYIEMERVTLNTVHSNLSGEMKQVIKATIAQSKEINAMQTEKGSIFSMINDIHSHFMPNSRPLPRQPNYAELQANAGKILLESPSNNPPHRQQQKTTEEADLQLPH
jgi:hypothetical protein